MFDPSVFKKGMRVHTTDELRQLRPYLPEWGTVANTPGTRWSNNDKVSVHLDGRPRPEYLSARYILPADDALATRMVAAEAKTIADDLAEGEGLLRDSIWCLMLSLRVGPDVEMIHRHTGIPLDRLWAFNARYRENGIWWFDQVDASEFSEPSRAQVVALILVGMVGTGDLVQKWQPPYVPRLPSPETTTIPLVPIRPPVRETRPRFDGCDAGPINPYVMVAR